MSSKLVRVRSLNLDGTASLEDGRQMQLVMRDTGALGLVPLRVEDHLAQLDQHVGTVDQGQAPVASYPDLSHLDQT